ncbi:MAG: DUF2085 domain-containing protein [Thermomicrobium sp.]|nr:DUF2085 domain-containing protein [Thermomicrobium sp.]
MAESLCLRHRASTLPRMVLALVVVLLVTVPGWLLSPSQVEGATRAALRGLCAQRPSHSFWFGPHRLPFDARMTGIYAGSFLTVVWLAARRPRGVAGMPHPLALTVLGAGVVVLGIDGMNALAVDLGLPSLYEPRNVLRYMTGAWTGTALGLLLWWVFQVTTWRPDLLRNERLFGLARDGGPLLGLLAGFGLLVVSGPVGWYVPVATLLVVAALVTLGLFAWPIALTVLGRIERVTHWRDLLGPAGLALALGAGLMALSSAARAAVEAALGIPPLP